MAPCNVLCSLLLSLTITAYIVIAVGSPSRSSSCHPDQRDALSRFNHSFSILPRFRVSVLCRDTSPKTVSWRESEDCCSWEGVACDNSTGDVVGLDLSCAWLQGTIDSDSPLFSLQHLRSLSLAQNDLVIGEVPHSIGSLPGLTYLDLSDNNITGNVDFQRFSTLKNLRFLGLSRLSVSGEDATDANNAFPELEELVIADGTLENFPCFFSSMPELRNMVLSLSNVSEFRGQCINNGLSFPLLESVEMQFCNLTNFPSFLSHSNKLRYLDLRGNMVEQIPSWFWGMGIDTLEELDLQDNLLRGGLRLPWKRLTHLYLQNNSFEGPLPIPTSRSIIEFYLSQNHFNESIPLSTCHLTSLVVLDLGQNNLTGVVPWCLGNLTQLVTLDLSSNSLTGTLPPSLANLTLMGSLDVSFNFLSQLPGDIFLSLYSLFYIELSTNKFEGLLPLPSCSIFYYSVSNNHFSGELSSSLCNDTDLSVLDLSNNGLTGTLPQCLKNITMSLECLNLRENDFHGSIPEVFHESSIVSLDFSRNRFEGSLPRSLSKCKSLEALDAGSNKIVDLFPSWLADLPLKVLSLRSNKFHGGLSVSEGTRPFSKIRVLDLSNNGFHGNLPDRFINETLWMRQDDTDTDTDTYLGDDFFPEYYSVMIYLKGVEIEMMKINVHFTILDFSSNHFQGEIPRSIGSLTSLKGLNFSHNGFTRTIPPSTGNLTDLESLDLSSNNLVGGIPMELIQLASLGALDLSWNNLTGPIPSGGHLNTFSNKSFEGNPGLCGIPLTRACSQRPINSQPPWAHRDDGEDETRGWSEWKFVMLGFGSGMGLGISLGYIALETGRPPWLARIIIPLESGHSKTLKRMAQRRNGRR